MKARGFCQAIRPIHFRSNAVLFLLASVYALIVVQCCPSSIYLL